MQVARRSAPQDTSAHESFLIFNFGRKLSHASLRPGVTHDY